MHFKSTLTQRQILSEGAAMTETLKPAETLVKVEPVQGRFIPGVAARFAEVTESEAQLLIASGAFTLATNKPAEPTAAKQSPEKE
jgi:hypothetical protein